MTDKAKEELIEEIKLLQKRIAELETLDSERKEAEKVLLENEARLRIVLETVKEGIIFSDEKGCFEVYNAEMERLTGYTKEEASGSSDFINLLYPDAEENRRARERLGALLRKTRDQEFESLIQRKDGQLRHVLVYSVVIPYQNRKMFLSTYYDITNRKRAEEELEKSEKRFRILFESSRDAIMTLEPPSWMFTSGNPATVEMFKAKDEADFTSHEPWTLSPERQPDGSASDEKAKEMIEMAMCNGSNFFYWTHKRINGEEFPAIVLLTRMVLAGKTMLQANVRDITERKKMEEEAWKSLRKLEVFYKASVGREERIIELKKEVEMLKKELGR